MQCVCAGGLTLNLRMKRIWGKMWKQDQHRGGAGRRDRREQGGRKYHIWRLNSFSLEINSKVKNPVIVSYK